MNTKKRESYITSLLALKLVEQSSQIIHVIHIFYISLYIELYKDVRKKIRRECLYIIIMSMYISLLSSRER